MRIVVTKVEIVPHPPEVIDVDPEILNLMKKRLAEENQPGGTYEVQF